MEPSWAGAIHRAARARVILVIGESDTGKTFFTTALANRLLARGDQVGVVDADLGQSEIGLPTTISLGRVNAPIERLAQAEVVGLYFVGAISPPGHLLSTVTGTKVMVDKALRLGMEKVVVDTSGLIHGEVGRVLKQHKIDLIDPDLIICLERGTECEHILRAYDRGTRLEIVRLAPSAAVKKRSQEERRAYREGALHGYFEAAKTSALDLSRIVLRQPALFVGEPLNPKALEELAVVVGDLVLWAEGYGNALMLITSDPLEEAQLRRVRERFENLAISCYSLDDFHGRVAGLEDREQQTLGLGVVRALDVAKQIIVIETPVPEAAIASIRIGRHRLHPA